MCLARSARQVESKDPTLLDLAELPQGILPSLPTVRGELPEIVLKQ
jgi:hypothetical protein